MSLLHRTRSTAAQHEPPLTPDDLAELTALDAALDGDPVTDEALAALVRDVRAAAPEMRPEATQQLNERVTARFVEPGRAGGARRQPRSWLGAHPALAAACGLVVVVLAAAGGVVALSTSSQPVPMSDTSMALPADADARGALERSDEDAAAAAATASGGVPAAASAPASGQESASKAADVSEFSNAPQQAQRLTPTPDTSSDRTAARAVERSVDLAVRVKGDELPKASAQVQRITRDANGYVATSDVSLGRAGQGGVARFQLRVDSSKLDRAVDRLAGLGTVLSQNESSRDITSALDGARSRLDDATQERKALLGALAKATSAGEIAALRTRIAENRRLRARLDADLQRAQRRADLTTIELTLSAPAKGDPTADDGNWTLGDAASDAWSALRSILGALLVAGAVLAPFALLAGAGWALTARARRAARERSLDA